MEYALSMVLQNYDIFQIDDIFQTDLLCTPMTKKGDINSALYKSMVVLPLCIVKYVAVTARESKKKVSETIFPSGISSISGSF